MNTQLGLQHCIQLNTTTATKTLEHKLIYFIKYFTAWTQIVLELIHLQKPFKPLHLNESDFPTLLMRVYLLLSACGHTQNLDPGVSINQTVFINTTKNM